MTETGTEKEGQTETEEEKVTEKHGKPDTKVEMETPKQTQKEKAAPLSDDTGATGAAAPESTTESKTETVIETGTENEGETETEDEKETEKHGSPADSGAGAAASPPRPPADRYSDGTVLDADTLIAVFTRLGNAALVCRCACVCSRWRDHTSDEEIWRPLFLHVTTKNKPVSVSFTDRLQVRLSPHVVATAAAK